MAAYRRAMSFEACLVSLCRFDVEGLADLGQDGVAVQDHVEGEADHVQLLGEPRVGVAVAVPVSAQPGRGGAADCSAHGPAPHLFVSSWKIRIRSVLLLARCWSRAASSFGVGLLVDDPDAQSLVRGDVGGGDVSAVVLDGDRRLVGPGPVQVLDEQLLVVTLLGAFDQRGGHELDS
jgi:hypothetical protein